MISAKRKICSVLLIVLLLATLLATMSACNFNNLTNGIEQHKDGMYYTVYLAKRYAEVHGFDKKEGSQVYEIPSTVKYRWLNIPVKKFSVSSQSNYKIVDGGAAEELIVPETLENLDLKSFSISQFESLEKITVSEKNSQYVSINGVVFTKDKSTLIFYPPAKTDNTLILPKQTSSISDYLYAKKYLSVIAVEAGNTSYSSVDGVLFTADGRKIICYPLNKKNETYVIPRSWSVFDTYHFETNDHLKYLEVEEGNTVFSAYNGDLYSVDGSILLYRPKNDNIQVLELPDNVTTISRYTLNYVKYLYVPAGLQNIVYDISGYNVDINDSNTIANVDYIYFESEELPFFLRYTRFKGRVKFGVTREDFKAEIEARLGNGEQL